MANEAHWKRYTARAARWTARILSALMVGLLGLFFFGEGVRGLLSVIATRPLSPETLMIFALGLLVIPGYVLGWRWEVTGGVMGLAGMVLFYGINFAASGRFPGGPVFPVMFAPPLLYLLAGALRHWKPAESLDHETA